MVRPKFPGICPGKDIISQAEGPGESPRKHHYFKSHTAKGTPQETEGTSSGRNKRYEEWEESSKWQDGQHSHFRQRSHRYRQESIGFGNLDVRVKLWVKIISH